MAFILEQIRASGGNRILQHNYKKIGLIKIIYLQFPAFKFKNVQIAILKS